MRQRFTSITSADCRVWWRVDLSVNEWWLYDEIWPFIITSPTYTRPGSMHPVYTGTTPATHGSHQQWMVYVKKWWQVHCIGAGWWCPSVSNVWRTAGNGSISSRNLLTTTITDELAFADKQAILKWWCGDSRIWWETSLPLVMLGDAYCLIVRNGRSFMPSNLLHMRRYQIWFKISIGKK